MKKLIISMAILAICLATSAQKVINDPNAVVRNVKGFHAIRISAGIDLYLSQGEEAVAISATSTEVRDRIQTVVENGVLKIYLENTANPFKWGHGNSHMKAYVSAKTLDNLNASGGSDVYIQSTFSADKLDITISGGSDLQGKLDVKDLTLDQSGGSDAEISGKANSLKVDASGGSDFKGNDFVTDYCEIVASGGSDAEITVNKELTAHASGGSDISYRGSGVIRDLHSSGSSSVKKRG
jgi:Putative auto-transporter adhesin, head GIN domain